MNRRDLLKAAVAAPLAGMLPGVEPDRFPSWRHCSTSWTCYADTDEVKRLLRLAIRRCEFHPPLSQ
jgi:hypothetical protein